MKAARPKILDNLSKKDRENIKTFIQKCDIGDTITIEIDGKQYVLKCVPKSSKIGG